MSSSDEFDTVKKDQLKAKSRYGPRAVTFKAALDTFTTEDNYMIYLSAIIIVLMIIIVVIYYIICGAVSQYFSEQWGPNEFDPLTGQLVLDPATNLPKKNPNSNAFLHYTFGNVGMQMMLFINAITYMFGGSRDIVYLVHKWAPNLKNKFILNLISISPLIIQILSLIICTVVLLSDNNAIGSYFITYGVVSTIIASICIAATWIRFYDGYKNKTSKNLPPKIIVTIINAAVLAYSTTLIGLYASTSDDIKNYVRSKLATTRSTTNSTRSFLGNIQRAIFQV